MLKSIDKNLDIRYQKKVDMYEQAVRTGISGLKYKPADYSAVETAKGKVPTDSSLYTEESWQNLQNKLTAVEEGLDIRYQEQVTGYAEAIEQALLDLKYIGADYTELEKAAAAARTEIETGWYTDESVAALQEVLDNIPLGLTVDRQGEVDSYKETIVKATKDLVKKLANYTELQKILDLLDNSSSEIYNNTYKNFDEVMALINAYREETVKNNMNLPIDKQSQVDEMTATLQGYIDSLELEEAKATFEAKEGSTTVIKDGYIYGLTTGLTKASFLNNFVTYENVTISYSGNKGRYLGTGTVVTATSTLTGEVIGTYTIIIYGDVSGDGVINSVDELMVSNTIQKNFILSPAASKAARLVSRKALTNADYLALRAVVRKQASINQKTGKLA